MLYVRAVLLQYTYLGGCAPVQVERQKPVRLCARTQTRSDRARVCQVIDREVPVEMMQVAPVETTEVWVCVCVCVSTRARA